MNDLHLMTIGIYLEYAGNKTSSIFAVFDSVGQKLVENGKERRVFSEPREPSVLALRYNKTHQIKM